VAAANVTGEGLKPIMGIKVQPSTGSDREAKGKECIEKVLLKQ
jgi:hypothetical protein